MQGQQETNGSPESREDQERKAAANRMLSERMNNAVAVASLIFACIALVLSCTMLVVGVFPAVAAAVFGFKALGAGCSRKIYAKIGIIVGVASLLLSFLMPMFLILRAG